MLYPELHSEFVSLLKDKAECLNVLAELRNGYISTKTITGKQYAYLQYRVDGKLSSEYIKQEHLPGVRSELNERADKSGKIREIDGRLEKIEAAARILDQDLYRKLILLRRCSVMETLPYEERKKSLVFGSAMKALEGIPVREETEMNLQRWANGDLSFQDSYFDTLRAYKLAEV